MTSCCKKTFQILTSIGGLFLLSGCGFQPLYSGSPCHKQNFELHVTGSGYPTYKFRREIEKQLDFIPQFDNETYILNISVTEVQTAASYQQDASITRKLSNLIANCLILKKQKNPNPGLPNNQPISTLTVNVETSYPLTPTDEFVSRNADKAASTRTAITLAEDLSRDILRVLKERAIFHETAPTIETSPIDKMRTEIPGSEISE